MGMRCTLKIEKEWRRGDHDYDDKERFKEEMKDEIC